MIKLASPLPPAEEREHLLDALAELIDEAGWEHFVAAPILRPTVEDFPDPWTPDIRGVRTLSLRFLRYAGLDDLDASVSLFGDDEEPDFGYEHSSHHQGAAAWFAGIQDGVCLFGAHVSKLADPLGVTAAMGHECAHAFRCARSVMVEDLTHEEQLTDLTTVYLGFGVLSLNASARHRSWTPGGEIRATAWSFQSMGYLSPQALGYLLAAQLLVRGQSPRTVRGDLEANQASYVDKAYAWLRRHVPDLRERLGIPDREAWPTPRSRAELLQSFDLPDPEPVTQEDLEPVAQTPAQLEVLRVPYSRSLVLGVLGGIIGLVAALAIGHLGPVAGLPGLIGAVGLAFGGWKLGAARPKWECSSCKVRVGRRDSTCRLCGGRFVGDLTDPADVLDDVSGDDAPIPVTRGYREEAEEELDLSLVDGSRLPHELGWAMASYDLHRALPSEVDNLRRRLDLELPDGYASAVEFLGAGTFCDRLELWLPARVLGQQVRALEPIRKGRFEHAPDGIDPTDAEGFTILGEANGDDLIATHRRRPGHWLWLRSEDGTIVDLGDSFPDADDDVFGGHHREVAWFMPASVVSRGEARARGGALDAMTRRVCIEFGPVYLEAQGDDHWLLFVPSVGAVVEATGSPSGWTFEFCTDSEHKDVVPRLVDALRGAGAHFANAA